MSGDCARCAMRGPMSVFNVAACLRWLRHACATTECFFSSSYISNLTRTPKRLHSVYTRVWRNRRNAKTADRNLKEALR